VTAFEFANPTVLLLLWIVPIAILGWRRLHRRAERRIGAFMAIAMQAKLRVPASSRRHLQRAGLGSLGLLMLVGAAAGPLWCQRELPVYYRGRDLVVVLDVSRSMLAGDLHPSRLERAKAEIIDLLEELEADRVALVAFRHRATLLCPLTRDYAFLRQALDGAGPGSAPRGETDIGSALAKAVDAFGEDILTGRAVILMSDGENLAGNTKDAIQSASAEGIPVLTVGLGSRQGARIPHPTVQGSFVTHEGRDVLTRLDDGVLRRIAASTGGAYIPLTSTTLGGVTTSELCLGYLREVNARKREELLREGRVQRYQWVLLPAFACFLLAARLNGNRPAGGRPRPAGQRPRVAIMPFFALLAFAAAHGASAAPFPAADPRRLARSAQNQHTLGDYEAAAGTYLRAAAAATGSFRRDLRYNAAASLFAAGEHGGAASILSGLSQPGSADAGRNDMALGCALFYEAREMTSAAPADLDEKATLLRRAAEAFQSAVRSDPGNTVAGTNLTVAVLATQNALREARAARLRTGHRAADRQPAAGTPDASHPEAGADHSAPETDRKTTPYGRPAPEDEVTDAADPRTAALKDSDVRRIVATALRREKEHGARTGGVSGSPRPRA